MWALEDGDQIVGDLGVRGAGAGCPHSAWRSCARRGDRGGGGRCWRRVEHARSCGAHKLDLEVWIDNFRAISLYASDGFEVEGMRRDHYRRRDGTPPEHVGDGAVSGELREES